MNARSNRFTLNRENRRVLGVCASLADYLEVPTVVIRVICFLAFLSWPTLILIYFGVYWWLKQGNEEGAVHHMISGSKTAEHFRKVDYRKAIYRNPNNARIAGVCSGIADYLEIKTFYVRLVTVLSFFFFGPFTFFAYCVCWLALERDPNAPARRSRRARRHERRRKRRHAKDEAYDASDVGFDHEDSDAETVSSAAHRSAETRSDYARREQDEASHLAMSLKECSEAFRIIEARLRGVEAFITSKKFRLHCEINRI